MALQLAHFSQTENHELHDKFVWAYLHQQDADDVVRDALGQQLQEAPNNALYTKIAELYALVVTDHDKRRVHHLAIYIMLNNYNKEWEYMFDATYELLISILSLIRKQQKGADVYPPMWTQKVFRLENIITPADLRGVMFGIDPIGKARDPHGQHATGHAFTFDMPTTIGNSYSTTGLLGCYGLAGVNLNDSISLETNFIEPFGIGLVNYIRTILRGSRAGHKNVFKDAWAKYNLVWLNCVDDVAVLIFQNEHFPFKDYASRDVLELEKVMAAPLCSHPSHIDKRDDHCLQNPNCTYPTKYGQAISCNLPNTSVVDFVTFLNSLDASALYLCPCHACIGVRARAAAAAAAAALLDEQEAAALLVAQEAAALLVEQEADNLNIGAIQLDAQE